ncbi:M3 family metallopeptidase, partial [Serratia marcescens]|uniref:M3 family metallopeptidase n=1 Tax=Serratia marcescens TaxID=615 RepID=UPI0013DA00EA
ANLPEDQQQRLSSINETLAGLGASFGQNVLGDEKGWSLKLTEEADLEGLPVFVKEAMAEAAKERGEGSG